MEGRRANQIQLVQAYNSSSSSSCLLGRPGRRWRGRWSSWRRSARHGRCCRTGTPTSTTGGSSTSSPSSSSSSSPSPSSRYCKRDPCGVLGGGGGLHQRVLWARPTSTAKDAQRFSHG
ncbi:hypothetical protein VPH35_086911 [Triticum aestivum]